MSGGERERQQPFHKIIVDPCCAREIQSITCNGRLCREPTALWGTDYTAGIYFEGCGHQLCENCALGGAHLRSQKISCMYRGCDFDGDRALGDVGEDVRVMNVELHAPILGSCAMCLVHPDCALDMFCVVCKQVHCRMCLVLPTCRLVGFDQVDFNLVVPSERKEESASILKLRRGLTRIEIPIYVTLDTIRVNLGIRRMLDGLVDQGEDSRMVVITNTEVLFVPHRVRNQPALRATILAMTMNMQRRQAFEDDECDQWPPSRTRAVEHARKRKGEGDEERFY